MPKFLYILLLVNLANACQSEHSGSHVDHSVAVRPTDDSLLPEQGSVPVKQPGSGSVNPQGDVLNRPSSKETPSAADSLTASEGYTATVKPGGTGVGSTAAKASSTGGQGNSAVPGKSGAAANPAGQPVPAKSSGNFPVVPQQIFTQWDALFADFDQFFRENVTSGKVRYGDLAVSPVVLKDLVTRIGAADLTKANPLQSKAFSINAYNVLVIWQVVEHYPIPSPMDIAGFFDRQTYLVAGKKKTLNDLEAGLRSDPRIHFALVCGALGCPKILNGAYMPGKLDQQLDAVTRQALNDPAFLRYQAGDQYAELSQIFNWYAQDFGGEDAVLAYINTYRTIPIPLETAISFYDYSWKLNNAP